jgi:hypothetical protein
MLPPSLESRLNMPFQVSSDNGQGSKPSFSSESCCPNEEGMCATRRGFLCHRQDIDTGRGLHSNDRRDQHWRVLSP